MPWICLKGTWSVIDIIYTSNNDDNIKQGLKQNLYYLLKRASKTLRAILLLERRDDIAALMQQFFRFVKAVGRYYFW